MKIEAERPKPLSPAWLCKMQGNNVFKNTCLCTFGSGYETTVPPPPPPPHPAYIPTVLKYYFYEKARLEVKCYNFKFRTMFQSRLTRDEVKEQKN